MQLFGQTSRFVVILILQMRTLSTLLLSLSHEAMLPGRRGGGRHVGPEWTAVDCGVGPCPHLSACGRVLFPCVDVLRGNLAHTVCKGTSVYPQPGTTQNGPK